MEKEKIGRIIRINKNETFGIFMVSFSSLLLLQMTYRDHQKTTPIST
jgi:hypothetical protein